VAADDPQDPAPTPPAVGDAEPPAATPAASSEPAVEGPGVIKAAAHDSTPPGGYHVQLPMFEGPLDLLLHLIKENELDILNIPIAFVSEKYFEYIKQMEEMSIDVASEYLVMAATLVYIKSRSLLPPSPEDQLAAGEEPEEDPRAELIRRLLAYQKYKLAAEQLGGRSVLGRDVFLRGAAMEAGTAPAELVPPSLFQLMDAFRGVLERAKQVADHEIDFERISITDRIGQLSDLLRVHGKLQFEDLFQGQVTRADLIVTFLAILEMTKLRLTKISQDNPLDPITVELSVRDENELADALQELSARENAEVAAADLGSDEGAGVGDGPALDDDNALATETVQNIAPATSERSVDPE
jgi:segregation and condensation protein A